MAASVESRPPLSFVPSSSVYDKLPQPLQQALDRMKQITVDLFGKMQETVIETDVPPTIYKIYEICTQTERLFNVVGCFPILGRLSGSLRCLAGKVQIATGIILTILSEISLFALKSSSAKDSSPVEKKWKMLAHLGSEMTLQGCLNTLRGLSEVFVGEYTFGLGNLVFIALNLKDERNFNPHFPYGTFAALVQKQEEAAAAAKIGGMEGDGGPHPFKEHEESKKPRA